MRVFNSKRIAAIWAVLGISLLSGCGSNGGNDAAFVGATGGVYGPGGTLNGGTCVPITSPIGFRIDGAYFDSANIVGGRLPYTNTSIGQSYMAAGGFGGPYSAGNWTDGSVSMQVNYGGAFPGGNPYQGYPNYAPNNPYNYGQQVNPNMVTLAGSVQVSPTKVAQIMSEMGGYYGGGYYPGAASQGPFQYGAGQPWWNGGTVPFANPAQGQYPCVSHVSMNIGHNGLQLYGGQIFIYMNGGVNGYVLKF